MAQIQPDVNVDTTESSESEWLGVVSALINVLRNDNYNVNKFSYLSGSTIHDDAASHHVRYMKDDFKQLRKVSGTLSGVTGQSDQPMIGNIVENEELI